MPDSPVAAWEAALPTLPAFLDWPEQPDYSESICDTDYLQWSGADIRDAWTYGDDDDRAAVDYVLDTLRERQRIEHHIMVFGAPPWDPTVGLP